MWLEFGPVASGIAEVDCNVACMQAEAFISFNYYQFVDSAS